MIVCLFLVCKIVCCVVFHLGMQWTFGQLAVCILVLWQNYAFYCSFTDLLGFFCLPSFLLFVTELWFDLTWPTGKVIGVLMLRMLQENSFCLIIRVKRENGSFFCSTVNIVLFVCFLNFFMINAFYILSLSFWCVCLAHVLEGAKGFYWM